MKSIIIGTAGHVDHGKTTLIKALTGIDTDRLKEEQARGMTIDLGFASLVLPSGESVSIVDVPGHERFIKNMLAGAGGVDVALLVIAADESVMPQTTEHLEILQLLETKRGVVALTKADMVDDEWLQMAREDAKAALASTFLADAPVIPVSAVTGMGLQELLSAIQEVCEDVVTKDSSGPFRLPVDRVFTMTGFGTIVTGTLVAGTMKLGDSVEILPKGFHSRVRHLQVHGKKVESVPAGTRVAVNLVGLEVSDLTRGDVCATPGTLSASSQFDMKLDLLPNAPKPLKNRTRVKLYTGTSELLGRITLLDKDELLPGDSAYIQFKSEEPAVAARSDRFVIRSYSPVITIGGGVVIDPDAKKHRRFDESVIKRLETSSMGTPEELLEQALKQSRFGMTCAEISKSVETTDICALFNKLLIAGKLVEIDQGRVIHTSVLNNHIYNIQDALARYHARYPLKPGMPREELRSSAFRDMDNKSFNVLVSYILKTGAIQANDTLIYSDETLPVLTPAQQNAMSYIFKEISDAGLNVRSIDDITSEIKLPGSMIKDILELLVHKENVIKVSDDLYFSAETIVYAENILRDYLEKNGKITVSQFRDITNSSRKYALPLLEYFDSQKLTRRVGDERILVKVL